MAKRGNTTPKIDHMKVSAANADAANIRYESMMWLGSCRKTANIPKPPASPERVRAIPRNVVGVASPTEPEKTCQMRYQDGWGITCLGG